jgi:hypothetical protein
MYFDDSFDPNEQNDSENESDYNEDNLSNMLSISAGKKWVNIRPSNEKLGYHVIYRQSPNTLKKLKIGIYETSTIPGRRIKNAVSGNFYDYVVGSINEDNLFKVSFSTGELGQQAIVLFFSDPGQFESHLMTKISDKAKSQWIEKQIYYTKMQSEKETKQTTQTFTVVH